MWKRELLKDKEVESNFNDAILKVMKSENSDIIDTETRWQKLEESVQHGAQKVIGVKEKREKKPWITEQLIDKMEERRKWKSVNGEEGRRKYRQLNNELRKVSDRAKEQWLIDRCTEIIEKLEENGQVDVMYCKVKELIDSIVRSRGIAAVMDRDGNLLTSVNDIKRRWKTYIEDLYNKQDKPTKLGLESEKQVLEDDIGPEMLNI